MNLAEVIFIAIGLAMDAFAVSLGAGTTGFINGPRPIFRLAFHFGLFQGFMPILGWLAGSSVAGMISAFDHWVAFGLLAFVGVRMVRSGLGKAEEIARADPSKGGTLVMLSVATSIDAFAVGLSLAMLHVQILYPSAVIGLVTAGLSLSALLLGSRLGETFGRRMEAIGGLILVGIGLRVVLAHLL